MWSIKLQISFLHTYAFCTHFPRGRHCFQAWVWYTRCTHFTSPRIRRRKFCTATLDNPSNIWKTAVSHKWLEFQICHLSVSNAKHVILNPANSCFSQYFQVQKCPGTRTETKGQRMWWSHKFNTAGRRKWQGLKGMRWHQWCCKST